MIKTIFILLSITAFYNTHAQNTVPAKDDIKTVRQTLINAGANEGEVSQFLGIRNSYNSRIDAAKLDSTRPLQEKEQKLQALNEEKNARYKQILGVEKYRKFNRLKNLPLDIQAVEKNEKTETESLKNTLISMGLSEQNAQQLLDVKRKYIDQMKELVADRTLSSVAKKKKVKDLLDEKNKAYKQVLGADKYHEYNQKKKLLAQTEQAD